MLVSKVKDYAAFFKEVKDRVRNAQYEALSSVNKELINLYWDLGNMIAKRQDQHGWGKSVVKNLAKDLQAEFPGIKGFSVQNLWYMRQFYLTYFKNPKLQPLVGEISWTKNLIIMSSCKDNMEKEFYIRMTRKFGWTKNVLIHQIDNQTYEKTLVGQTNFDRAVTEEIRDQAKLAVKDEYTFDFIELSEEHEEVELERALLSKVNRFLIEMGGAFAFMGNQFRLEINGNEFFIDILLYHRRLKCFVAVELKVGKFLPEYVGKMQFYLAALDDRVKEKGEKPSIGIILCKDKDRTIVEYALKESKKPIGVSTYRIVKKLPFNLRGELPEPRQIERLLDSIDKTA